MRAGNRTHQAVVIAEGPELCSLLRNAGALVVETGSLVQSIAAVAVHDPHRDPAADAAAMASAAAGMRTGSIEYARGCGAEAGTTSLAGLVGGQVIAGGGQVAEVLREVLAALLRPDTELVTLVRGAAAEPGLDGRAADLVREFSPRAEVTCYDGGMASAVLLIGAE
jgi:dihydroxyacetone kinase-like predicted kinase